MAFDAFFSKNALLPVTHCYSRRCNSCNFRKSQISCDLIYFSLNFVRIRDVFVDNHRCG